MSNAIFHIPKPVNELILNYTSGSPEKVALKSELNSLMNQQFDIPMFIAGREVRTGNTVSLCPPHDHKTEIGKFHMGDASHVKEAIYAALQAKKNWENLHYSERAAVFLKAADLISGPWRARINATTMLAQSKNVYQSEIDAVCEMADFFRFNAYFMEQIYQDQPMYSPRGMWNRMEYRALEGFVFAITPFNFTSIAANLPAAPALMGNTVVWKPANSQIYSAWTIMQLLHEAGLPAGVINLVYADGPIAGAEIFNHPDFAGLHFTGSTGVFQSMWKTIGENISKYRSYPRIVGETGGKDFVFAHPSADPISLATSLSRGAFEYQGQKCSAASRAYIPKSIYFDTVSRVIQDMKSFAMGSPLDFRNFINAVIDEKSFDKIAGYIEAVKNSPKAEIIAGGNCDKSKGYFVEPTLIKTTDPKFLTMCEEIFGPVLTIYEYEDEKWEETIAILDSTSPYALTGSFFARDRHVIERGTDLLRQAAGNFYINDKPTGAVVGQQPFGGARGSGTNDKAGSYLNLIRWTSPRTIKETFIPQSDYRYPFLAEE